MLRFDELTNAEHEKFFNSIELVMCDCDGVLWRGDTLPGCGDVINKFREMGKKVVLISNNSSRPIEAIKSKLKKANIVNFPDEDILTPAITTVNYLKSINFKKKVYAPCNDYSLELLSKAGFDCDNGANLNPRHPEEQLDLDPDVGAVVVDPDMTLNYMMISKAIHYLQQHDDILFLTGGTDNLLPITATINVIGVGYFIDLIATASKRQPMVLGKPGRGLGEILKKNYSIKDPKTVIFIGDSLEQDMIFAHEQGFRSLLVLSGVTDLETAKAGMKVPMKSNDQKVEVELFKPEFYVQTLASLSPLLDQIAK